MSNVNLLLLFLATTLLLGAVIRAFGIDWETSLLVAALVALVVLWIGIHN